MIKVIIYFNNVWIAKVTALNYSRFVDSIEHLSNFSRLVGLFQNKRLVVIISGVRLEKYGL
jgi:hypothetical protein